MSPKTYRTAGSGCTEGHLLGQESQIQQHLTLGQESFNLGQYLTLGQDPLSLGQCSFLEFKKWLFVDAISVKCYPKANIWSSAISHRQVQNGGKPEAPETFVSNEERGQVAFLLQPLWRPF